MKGNFIKEKQKLFDFLAPRFNMKKCLIIIILFLFSINSNAQKVDQFNSWWYYSGKYTVAKKLNIQTLYAWSRHDFIKNWQQSKLKFGVNYNYSKNFSFGGGYEWIVLFPYGEHPIAEKRTEHRIYEQFEIKTKLNNISIKFCVLQEQRIFKTKVNHRTRIKILTKMPIFRSEDGETKLSLSIFNQVFLNVEKNTNNNHFNQNRIYGGLDFPCNKSLTLSLGYMNQYLVINSNRIENNHTLMIGLFHKLSFVKGNKLLN